MIEIAKRVQYKRVYALRGGWTITGIAKIGIEKTC